MSTHAKGINGVTHLICGIVVARLDSHKWPHPPTGAVLPWKNRWARSDAQITVKYLLGTALHLGDAAAAAVVAVVLTNKGGWATVCGCRTRRARQSPSTWAVCSWDSLGAHVRPKGLLTWLTCSDVDSNGSWEP
jgi:hypothetical protein